MRLSDLQPNEIKPGMRVRSLVKEHLLGTILSQDKNNDYFTTIYWDDSTSTSEHISGFYDNNCECEVIEV